MEDRFDVQMKREYYDQFKDRAAWNRLDEEGIRMIEKHLSPLILPETINEKARRFDLMMFKLEQAKLLMLSAVKGYEGKVLEISDELSKKYSVPQVLRSKPLIERLRNPDFYKDLTQRMVEEIRQELRELVQYIEDTGREPIITDFVDTMAADSGIPYVTPMTNELYKRQMERFVREHKDHITISKLNTNLPITEAELMQLQRILFDGGERGTYETYQEVYGDEPLGKFVRSIVGLDIQAAQQAFADFIQSGNLTADQMKFIDTLIRHLNRNGTISKELLFQPPFTDMNDNGLIGVFDDTQAVKIIQLLDEINKNADVG